MVRLDCAIQLRFAAFFICIAAFVLCPSPATLFAHEHNAIATDKLPPLIRTAKSGNWSDAATWEGGKLPRPASACRSVRHTVSFTT